jgi:hypothetical protein
MALKNDYQRIAERALLACDASLAAGIHEKAGFLAYHAFESAGCALAAHVGLPVGGGVKHTTKIRHFQSAARTLRNEKPVAALAVTLSNLRNSMLYPVPNRTTGSAQIPERVITPAEAKELRKRVGGIVKWVDSSI